MCGQNEQTYFYTQFLLQRLMAGTFLWYNITPYLMYLRNHKSLQSEEIETRIRIRRFGQVHLLCSQSVSKMLNRGRAVHVMDSLLSNINEYPTVASGYSWTSKRVCTESSIQHSNNDNIQFNKSSWCTEGSWRANQTLLTCLFTALWSIHSTQSTSSGVPSESINIRYVHP